MIIFVNIFLEKLIYDAIIENPKKNRKIETYRMNNKMNQTRRDVLKSSGIFLSLLLMSPHKALGKTNYKTQQLDKKVLKEPLHNIDLNNNIGYLALNIEKQSGLKFQGSSYSLLEEILNTAEKKIKIEKKPKEILIDIHSLLVNDFNFNCKRGIYPDRFSEILKNNSKTEKFYDCDTGGILLIAIGEKIGIPIKGVLAPYHFFNRYESIPSESINFEIHKAKFYGDQFYKEYFDISDISIKKGVYLKSLSKKEVLASVFLTLGISFQISKSYKNAIEYYNHAIKLNPNYLEAYNNKKKALIKLGRYDEAVENSNKVMNLYPDFVRRHNVVKRKNRSMNDYASIFKLKNEIYRDFKFMQKMRGH